MYQLDIVGPGTTANDQRHAFLASDLSLRILHSSLEPYKIVELCLYIRREILSLYGSLACTATNKKYLRLGKDVAGVNARAA